LLVVVVLVQQFRQEAEERLAEVILNLPQLFLLVVVAVAHTTQQVG
jgi:hypothetical protein